MQSPGAADYTEGKGRGLPLLWLCLACGGAILAPEANPGYDREQVYSRCVGRQLVFQERFPRSFHGTRIKRGNLPGVPPFLSCSPVDTRPSTAAPHARLTRYLNKPGTELLGSSRSGISHPLRACGGEGRPVDTNQRSRLLHMYFRYTTRRPGWTIMALNFH